MRANDLSGVRFGLLTAIRPASKDKKGRIKWQCICDCGAVVQVQAASLRRTDRPTRSCGCLHAVLQPRTHGRSKFPEYQVWRNMHARCTNPAHPQFHHYGGRGISVCSEWASFENFWNDMGRGYTSGLYLDRIDVNGNYCPENCRWVTPRVSSENRRNAILIELDGRIVNLSVVARERGVCYTTLFLRHKRGVRIFKEGQK